MKASTIFLIFCLGICAVGLSRLPVQAASIISIADLTASSSTPTATPVVSTDTPAATPTPSALPDTGINLAAVFGLASVAMIALSAYQIVRRASSGR